MSDYRRSSPLFKFLLLFLLQRPACGWVEHNRGRGGKDRTKYGYWPSVFRLSIPAAICGPAGFHMRASWLPYAGQWASICGPASFSGNEDKKNRIPFLSKGDPASMIRLYVVDNLQEQESLISNVVYYNFRMQDDLHSDLTPRHNLMLEACHTIFLFERIIMHHDTPSQVVIMYKHVTKGLRPLRP